MSKSNEVEGGWTCRDCPARCRKCGSILIECPREGHLNSKFWIHEREDGLILKVCPNNCLEKDARKAFQAKIN